MRVALVALALALCTGCLKDPPPTSNFDLGEECAGTEEGMACVTLHFVWERSSYDATPGDRIGDLHWALFREGDVGFFGPGDNIMLYGDFVPGVSMANFEDTYSVHIPNVEPISYQALGFLDDDLNMMSNTNDPVTLPSEPFLAEPNERTLALLVLNWVR